MNYSSLMLVVGMSMSFMHGMEPLEVPKQNERTRIQKVVDALMTVWDSRVVNAGAKIGGLACYFVIYQILIMKYMDMTNDMMYATKDDMRQFDEKFDSVQERLNRVVDWIQEDCVNPKRSI